jgi:hypothetical protein
MAYDDFPLEVIAQKEQLIHRYRDRRCWFTFYHDVYMNAGRMDASGRVAPS